eukprot:Em0008g365a
MKDSTKPIKKSKKSITKSKKPITKSKQPIKATNQKIEATNQEIKETNQKIEAFVNSNEYKDVARHFAWGKSIPGTSEEDKTMWCYFQFKLDHLNQEKQGLSKTIEGLIKTIEGLNQSKEDLEQMIKDLHQQNAAAFKKTDITRKRYKHEAAVNTSVAHFLSRSYKFQLLYEKMGPTFGNVMKAASFFNKDQVRHHFQSSKSKSTGTVSGPIQEVFTEDQWYTLLEMNYRVNRQLHGTLSEEYVVLESQMFKSSAKIVEEICQLCNFDNIMDIKKALLIDYIFQF